MRKRDCAASGHCYHQLNESYMPSSDPNNEPLKCCFCGKTGPVYGAACWAFHPEPWEIERGRHGGAFTR